YGEASKAAASSVAGDRDAAREMAAASWEVAAAWREMESTADIPWWALAALCAAAQAFEIQARDWNARAAHGWPADDGRRSRPNVQLAARARPKVCREREASKFADAIEPADRSEGPRDLLRGGPDDQ